MDGAVGDVLQQGEGLGRRGADRSDEEGEDEQATGANQHLVN